ncbi:HlyD family efflux transporter periplasmic adaptor subunit [uncultured Cohaesibacter sp.]|uniref:efflux RND transporter periplasmic adaptor subunit n=1 Tax=uncultured Cohaesibacter sp. TaxID=1002546 RepID=UPI002AAB9DA6|nr:HlyD family efflux transporter periplasmic adaptor subunit [uncultured Cohaesibacter sp.]
MARKRSRSYFAITATVLVVAALAYAFWPRPTSVDMGEAKMGAMQLTVNEEGFTRVHDAYVVSSPVAGRLLRVEVEPGDPVVKGETVIAQMRPSSPAMLDIRTREQARASVTAAEATLRVARADLNKAKSDLDLASQELDRTRRLAETDTASKAALDRAEAEYRAASATKDNAEAVIAVREAELDNARARLIGFEEDAAGASSDNSAPVPLTAPTTGTVLRVIQKSETTLSAGTDIMEIGNIDHDLEVVVELLSTDAVQVSPGDRVMIADWGGNSELEGTVERVEPWGYTKYSSLGVEEQRVKAIIRFTSPKSEREKLGHGYRVEVKIVIWSDDNTLLIPSNALFRDGETWAVFRVVDKTAYQTRVKVGKDNGISAQILDGLSAGDQIVLYPSAGLADSAKVVRRMVQ